MAFRDLRMLLERRFLGPRLVTSLRERGIAEALRELAEKVPEEAFERAFGAGKVIICNVPNCGLRNSCVSRAFLMSFVSGVLRSRLWAGAGRRSRRRSFRR